MSQNFIDALAFHMLRQIRQEQLGDDGPQRRHGRARNHKNDERRIL
ncbi:hypothetical protein GCM10023169_25710 [Georgenia halophila]|uniref:Uncharacterized protein n=1 Tax=Georgenia halophila TaxID=620889 RepID=A0ABP8LD27_9MICO